MERNNFGDFEKLVNLHIISTKHTSEFMDLFSFFFLLANAVSWFITEEMFSTNGDNRSSGMIPYSKEKRG